MANILYKKLQQAKAKFHESSSNMFLSFNNANIDKYTSKKISIIAYWLEILEEKIQECSQGVVVNPEDLVYKFGSDISFLTKEAFVERFYIRNKHNVLVPLLEISVGPTHMYYNENYPFGSFNPNLYSHVGYIMNLASSATHETSTSVYNNFDKRITTRVVASHELKIKFNDVLRPGDVGDMYNGQSVETTNTGISLSKKIVVGGVSPVDCKSLTKEEYAYYDEILNLISIELKFNYSFTESEATDYKNIISGDSNQTLTTESGSPLEF